MSRGPSADEQARSSLHWRNGRTILEDGGSEQTTDLSALAAGESNDTILDRLADMAVDAALSEAEVNRRAPVFSGAELLATGSFEVARRQIARLGDERFVHSIVSTPYTSAKYVTGFYGLMLMMRSDKALLHYVIERCLHAALGLLEAWASLGVHGVWLQETLSSADIISPAAFEEFVYPGTRRLIDRCRALGLKVIFYPTGDVIPRLPLICEMAPDALAVEEGKKNFTLDIAQIREAIPPQLCLFGNLDAYGVLELAGDAGLAEEVLRQLRAGQAERGAFVQGMGSPITPDTPPARIRHYLELCRELGALPTY